MLHRAVSIVQAGLAERDRAPSAKAQVPEGGVSRGRQPKNSGL
jgi:hypothetical protein